MVNPIDRMVSRWNNGGSPMDPADTVFTNLKLLTVAGTIAAVAFFGVRELTSSDSKECSSVTVEQGDTLRGIAAEYTDTNQARTELTDDLIKQNSSSTTIHPGDKFYVCA